VTPTGWRSGGRNMQLAKQLLDWHRLDATIGKLFDSINAGFHCLTGPSFCPDASWRERRAMARLPRLVTNVFPAALSGSRFRTALQIRFGWKSCARRCGPYSANGCKLGVLIDPDGRIGRTVPPRTARCERREHEPISLAELPGFVLDPGKLD